MEQFAIELVLEYTQEQNNKVSYKIVAYVFSMDSLRREEGFLKFRL